MTDLIRRRVLVAFLLATALTAALTFPGDYSATSPGLDPSWMWGINYFSQIGARFGRDVIFTYGPLGYLLHPLPVGSHVGQGVALRLLVSLVMFGCLLATTLRRGSVASGFFFLGGYLILMSFWLAFDDQMLAASAFMLAVGIAKRRAAVLAAPTVFCGALIFMKFGSGLSAGVLVLVTAGVWWLRWRTPRGPAVLFATYGMTILVLGLVFLGSYASLLSFLRLSFQIAHGYNDAMSTDGPRLTVIGGLVVLVIFSAVTLVMSRRHAPSANVLLLLILPVFLSFKHSFVRQDWGHEPFVFGLALSGLILAIAFAVQSGERWALIFSAVAVLVTFQLTEDPRAVKGRLETFKSVITGASGMARLESLLHLSETVARLQSTAANALEESDKLPSDWRERIGSETVLVIPAEIALCAANGLRCQPYPTMQMYSTYTQELDRWAANEIRRSAPRYVIAEISAIDGRNMVWDCPETWQALTTSWEVAGWDSGRPRLLLKQRSEPVHVNETSLAQVRARVGDWIPVPSTPGLVRLSLETRERWSGRLRRLFFRSEPVLLQLRFGNAGLASFRLVLDTARSGILLTPVVTNLRRFDELFAWTNGERIRAVRLLGPGTRWLQPEVGVTWKVLQPVLPTLDEAAAPPNLSADPAFVAIDAVNGESTVGRTQPILTDQKMDLTVSGWAVDKEGGGIAGTVYLRIDDGALEVEAEYGGDRADVARYFSQPNYRFIGFNGTIEGAMLERGPHKLRIRIVSVDGRRTAISNDVSIDVR